MLQSTWDWHASEKNTKLDDMHLESSIINEKLYVSENFEFVGELGLGIDYYGLK